VRFAQARDKKLHLQLYLIKMCFIGRSIRAAQEKKNELSELKPVQNAPIAPKPLTDAPQIAAPAPVSKSFAASKELLGIGASLNVQQLEAETKAEIARKAADLQDNTHLLTVENLCKQWLAFAETVDSPTFKLILQNSAPDLQLDGETALLTVSSSLAKGQLDTDAALMTYLRHELACPALALRIDIARIVEQPVAETQIPLNAPPKHLGPNDKLRIMAEENTLVRDFYRKFDLRVD
jgi:hypothetical protein